MIWVFCFFTFHFQNFGSLFWCFKPLRGGFFFFFLQYGCNFVAVKHYWNLAFQGLSCWGIGGNFRLSKCARILLSFLRLVKKLLLGFGLVLLGCISGLHFWFTLLCSWIMLCKSWMIVLVFDHEIQVEHIVREENMMAAQEIIELFCELITVRLPIIESQRFLLLLLKTDR